MGIFKKSYSNYSVKNLYIPHKEDEYLLQANKSNKEQWNTFIKEGTIVKHKKYGLGKVISIKDVFVTVSFNNKEEQFLYPSAFTSQILEVLILDDEIKYISQTKENKKDNKDNNTIKQQVNSDEIFNTAIKDAFEKALKDKEKRDNNINLISQPD